MSAAPLKITFDFFLDRDNVQRAVDRGERRGLMRVGGNVRTIARRSIRPRKKSAPPGQPPSSHDGGLRKGIFFAYEPIAHTVVVGPLGKRTHASGTRGAELLEHGGTVTRKRRGRSIRHRYRGNPFMAPALQTSRATLPDAWRNVIR